MPNFLANTLAHTEGQPISYCATALFDAYFRIMSLIGMTLAVSATP